MKNTIKKSIKTIKPQLEISFNLISKLEIHEKQNWLNTLEDATLNLLKILWKLADKSYSLNSFSIAIIKNKEIKWDI